MTMAECIFCQIIAGKLPAAVILENDQVIVIKDIAPKAPIHYLIIPKKHVPDIESLAPVDYDLGALIFSTAQKLAQQQPELQDFNMLINNGRKAGQIIFHLHAHFLVGAQIGKHF